VGPEKKRKEFHFSVSVPGLKVDFEEANYIERVRIKGIQHLDEEQIKEGSLLLQCCTTNKKGTKDGDPLNLAVIGELQDILAAFGAAGWDVTETLSFKSVWKMVRSITKGRRYRYSPVSPLYFLGNRQDVALQKARKTINQRLHLRFWMTAAQFDGEPIWIGQVSRDIGIRFTWRTWNLTTHKIDPDVDDSREYVLADLADAKRVARFGYLPGVGPADRSNPRKNLTGDAYYTDGLRLVMEVSRARTEPEFMGWEFPFMMTTSDSAVTQA